MSNKKPNIHIIQPVIPEYRVDFFERLQSTLGDRLYLYCSDSWPKAPKLVIPNINNFNGKLSVTSFKNKVFYQSILPVLKNVGSGDVVIISGNPRVVSNFFIIAYCKVVKTRVVWWGHGWSAGSRGSRSNIRQQIMKLADAILLYTDSEKEEYEKNSYVDKPIFALNNGINLEEVDRYFKQDWIKFGTIDNVAVYCGRLSEKSNILLLLEAVRKSKQIKKLIVVGDGELFEQAVSFISDNNLTGRIEMLGAVYDPRRLAEIFSRASLFVFPGAIGLSLIHAMAYGLPIILHANRYNHGPENVAANNENSIFFIEQNSESLSASIDEYFLLDSNIKLKLAKNARKVVEKNFNTKYMAENLLKMLSDLSVNHTNRVKKSHRDFFRGIGVLLKK